MDDANGTGQADWRADRHWNDALELARLPIEIALIHLAKQNGGTARAYLQAAHESVADKLDMFVNDFGRIANDNHGEVVGFAVEIAQSILAKAIATLDLADQADDEPAVGGAGPQGPDGSDRPEVSP